MHPNICTYSKAVFEEALAEDYEGIIFTTCCDSMRRLYDTLKAQFPQKFIYMLDLPHKSNTCTTSFYRNHIETMIKTYEVFKHTIFNFSHLKELLEISEESLPTPSDPLQIGVMGARCNESIINLLKEKKRQYPV